MKADFAIGEEIAGYRIEALVGRGGMGVVYRAEQVSLGRTVAVKVLAPDLAEDEKFRARFERESRLAALIDHPNILPVYEAGEAGGLLFLAMRWVDGSDLRALLKREGPLTLERTLSLLGQVASALDAAHARGLIHRDVKPANILVAPGGGAGGQDHAYLSDFGVAKMSSSASFTMTGFFVGTPDYAAPEQFVEQELDGRVDVYAVGCLLVHCLTGSPPFVRTQDAAVMYAHLHDPPPRLSELRPDLPEGLDDVVAVGMAKQRDDRYATAGELIATAKAAAAGRAAPRTRPQDAATELREAATVTPATVAAPGAPTQRAEPRETDEAWRRTDRRRLRRRIVMLAAAVLVLAGAGAAAAILATRGGGSPAPETHAGTSATSGGTVSSTTLAWSRVDDPALGGKGNQEIARLAALPGGSLLGAGDQGPPQAHAAVVWTSAGAAQEPSASKEVLQGPAEAVAYGVSRAGGDTAVVVGYSQPQPPRGDTSAAVWLRAADGTWGVSAGVPANPYYEKMNRVARNPRSGVLAAVGAAGLGYYADGNPLPTDAAVWTSEDGGSTWSRIGPEELAKDGYQEMRAVTGYADGFVAVGHDRIDAAVWRSNGEAWSELARQPAFASGTGPREMRGVRPYRGGLVAVGYRTGALGRDAAVWISEDGETWTLVDDQDLGGAGDQVAFGVVTGSFGIVAVGCTGCRTSDARPAVWMSDDGRSWTKATGGDLSSADGPQQLNDVVVAGGSLVAGGWVESGSNRDAVLWRADVPG